MSADCLTCAPYATIDDLRDGAGVPEAAFASVPLKAQQSALLRACRTADTFLRNRYQLPLKCPYDPALVQWVCFIATYFMMSFRGFNPNQGVDTIIRMNYDDTIRTLIRVANGQQQLCVVQTAPGSLQPEVGTNESRGFGGNGALDVPFVGPNTWGQ